MSLKTLESPCFETETINNFCIVDVNLSQATYSYAGEFKNCIEELIKLGNFNIIINFSDCRYIDSTFLGCIALILRSLKTVNGTIKIVYTHSIIKSIMETNGITRVIDIYDDLQNAIK